jgi:serine/threonine protein kinase
MSDILKDIWPDWTITEKLGSGAFGTVYSAKKEDGGHIYESAIKVIHIPQDDAEVRDLRYQGKDYQSICSIYKNIKEDLRNEISIMETLRTANNIVTIEDYKEVPSEDGIGWTVFIRMEKLTSLIDFRNENKMTLDDIVKLGQDICGALVYCEKEKVIHRDIKPANVFVNKYGDYKLGDFGISRQLEKTQSVHSQKGTYQYMAPEVYHGESYNQTVDIYSLGIMLYQLLNDGRFPFSPPASQMPKADDNERALSERMQGKDLPTPSALAMFGQADMDMGKTDKNSVSRLVDIVLKACSYRADDRYQSASEMAEKLRKWVIRNENEKEDEKEELTRKQAEPVTSNGYAAGVGSSKQPLNDTENNKKNVKTETFNQDEGTIGYISALKNKNDGKPEEAEDKPELKSDLIDWELIENIPIKTGELMKAWLNEYDVRVEEKRKCEEKEIIVKSPSGVVIVHADISSIDDSVDYVEYCLDKTIRLYGNDYILGEFMKRYGKPVYQKNLVECGETKGFYEFFDVNERSYILEQDFNDSIFNTIIIV